MKNLIKDFYETLKFKFVNMTFAPDKKTSKSRTGRRTTNWIKLTALKLKNLVSINKAGTGLSHFVDENGMYKGRQVLAKKSKAKKTTRI